MERGLVLLNVRPLRTLELKPRHHLQPASQSISCVLICTLNFRKSFCYQVFPFHEHKLQLVKEPTIRNYVHALVALLIGATEITPSNPQNLSMARITIAPLLAIIMFNAYGIGYLLYHLLVYSWTF